MKEYFSHDYSTRLDDKIKKLIRKHGMLGYGCYWSIIEDLYNNANALRTDYDSIAYDLRVDENIVKSIINDFGLFVLDGSEFGSISVGRRIDERNAKSIKARESARKRWEKAKNDANALRPHYDRNAIKENKRKEKKRNNIEERKQEFKNSLALFLDEYGKDLLNDFYSYWTEHGENDKKMRFEKQTSFSISRRLSTWKKNQGKFSKNNKGDYRGADRGFPKGYILDQEGYEPKF